MWLIDILKKSNALSTYQISAAIKPQKLDHILEKRERVIQAVQHQIDAVECEIAGRSYFE